ncbi:putative P-loop containing nucleoside triphosphate hydrolase protein [Seiridium unicorne]|uniref:P-loop containing nucleoside triphosphate hydrolase protein n=1 Tax=Seiridium unicorne TaxID=138068 RepID=A0ABR2VJD6_9PEZI
MQHAKISLTAEYGWLSRTPIDLSRTTYPRGSIYQSPLNWLMEVTGLAVGFVGLAGVFSTCVDCYQLLRRGVELDKDYKILETKFNNQELRFVAWERACGLSDGRVRDDRLEDSELQAALYATLECIKDLFRDERTLKKRYGLRPCEISTQPLLTTRENVATGGLARAALGEKFVELVQHLKGFNDDLESLTRTTGVPRRQRIIVEYEIEEIDDMETPDEIAVAAQQGSDLVSDTASQRLSILQNESTRTSSIRASTDTFNTGSFHTARSNFSLDLVRPWTEAGSSSADVTAGGENPESTTGITATRSQDQSAALEPVVQRLKCVAVGDAGCGKTQLLSAIAGRLTPGNYIPTVFDNYAIRCNISENDESRTLHLGLFDTAGQEGYPKLRPLTYAETDVFVVCIAADVSMERFKASVEDEWVAEIRRFCPGVPFAVASIHNDWDDADDIPGALLSIDPEQRINLAREIGAFGYFDIWPCTRIRVDQTFTEIVGAAVAYNEAQKRWQRPQRPQSRRRSLLNRLLTIRE